MYQEKVKDIRANNIQITTKPIIYYWWFKESCFDQLFNLLNGVVNLQKITKKTIDGKTYGLLYIGKAINGNERLVKYHILDKSNYHFKGVKNRRLSSLRQTLCGLLGLPMSNNKQTINDFMDENCIVEWKEISFADLEGNSEKDRNNIIEKTEREEIQEYYLPLNDKGSSIGKEHRAILRNCKKEQRK